jgi:CSLREA domain-containing protein
MLAAPAAAGAEDLFTVDSTADEADAMPGVGGCLTLGGKCTLRAAIEESNASAGALDEIVFDELVFDGQATGTITLGSSLAAVVDPVRINGRECPTAAGVGGPCVGIAGPSAGPALTVENAEGVEIEGLAVTGAQTGISVEGSEFFKARANWFGVDLEGDESGNTTGVFIDPGSSNSRIGGEGPDAGNVLAGNAGNGLEVHGASNVKVLGNYFGVQRDGVTPAANGKDIEVTSVAGGGPEATGTTIGTRVSAGAAATPACDGGCNLISGAASSGIDLGGDGGEESPASVTTIAGNYIGLNATGSAPIPNASSGIRVGSATQTVIGGPKAGEANRINGGDAGILAGPAAADLVVRNNSIGVGAAGTAALGAPDEAIVVDSEGLSSAAVDAAIVDNEIRMQGGVAITQRGFGARIADNEVFDAEAGIKVTGPTGEHGNLIEGNSIEGLEVSGILVENDFNEIAGNKVSGSAGAGIWLRGLGPFGLAENLVGGDAADEENVITGSGAAAIEITSTEETRNEVARNRGLANGGPFIDLLAAGAEPHGPNGGIEPPQFTVVARAGASGSADAGAKVRVFRKQIIDAGEIASFLGEATADPEGNWAVAYGEALPAGAIVAATQTSEGGTSELAAAVIPAELGGVSGAGGGVDGAASGPVDKAPPQTAIVKAPKKSSPSRVARFKFASDEPSAAFQCKLDGGPFKACKSPVKYGGLKPGKHVFRVRAVDPAGNLDASPAKAKFTVLGGVG